jgi:uncharacterized membrane protein YeaQ/YmgE (transglycosylase-associated protein family)
LSAGALAGLVVGRHGYGVVGDIVVRVIGAGLGGWMSMALLGIADDRFLLTLVMAFIGAVTLLWVIRRVAPSHS